MGLMQSVHMRRLAVHCRAPEEEHVYADRIVEQAAYFGISTDAAVVEIKSLLGAGDDSRAGQKISDCGMRIADLNGACGGASRSWRKSFSSAF